MSQHDSSTRRTQKTALDVDGETVDLTTRNDIGDTEIITRENLEKQAIPNTAQPSDAHDASILTSQYIVTALSVSGQECAKKDSNGNIAF